MHLRRLSTPVKPRVGDRRAHVRFEIVGTLVGSVEVWRPLVVRDLGLRGVLLETEEPLRVGTRVKGRLKVGDLSEDVEGEVRHEPAAATTKAHYAGVAFADALSTRMADALRTQEKTTASGSAAHDLRRGWRIACFGGAVLDLATWASVRLRDLSMGGAMFTTGTALEAGRKGRLRAALGSRSFVAEIELRRIEAPEDNDPRGVYRIGALFLSMDAGSRHSLASFLATVTD
jgi:hypothetical protein